MQKYECVRSLFSQLLGYPYQPFNIELSEQWQLKAVPGSAKIDPDKPYLGTLPIEVEFYCGEEKRLNWQLTMRCLQTSYYPSLEDGEGGYAFLIRSSKSELLFRAMQAAKFVQESQRTVLTISTDLNSKKGIGGFRQNMERGLKRYASVFTTQGAKLIEPNQFAFIDFDPESNAIVQDGQSYLKSALLLATMKAMLKEEISIPFSIVFGQEDIVDTAMVQRNIPGSQAALIEDFHRYLQSYRLKYSKEFVGRFVTSLQAKPFLILSGTSGTGKTKIAQHFAAYMNEGNTGESLHNVPAEARARSFHLQLQPYMFEYQRMMVTVRMLEWVIMDTLEQGVEVEVRFGGQTEISFMKKQRNAVRLGFRKHFMAWLKRECRTGDSLLLTIEEDGKVFVFSKDNEMVKPLDSNLAFVSVRPDWLNNRSLLGYYNPLTEEYELTPFLKLILRAEQNPTKPYFVILDEMNLAKVEYYFSDFLSCLESRRFDEIGRLKQEAMILHQLEEPLESVDESNRVYVIPSKVYIPENVYIIGTVNIDETTHMFSPKVLDRANVLECNDVDFQSYWISGGEQTVSSSAFDHTLTYRSGIFSNEGKYHLALYRKDFLNRDQKLMLQAAFEVISNLQEIFTEEGFSFGYRVLDETMTYVLMAMQSDSGTLETALDAQIVQKILPKLHGNRKQLEYLLLRLLNEFTLGTLKGDLLSLENREILAMEESHRFPLSSKKVYAMYKQLLHTGYCSFIC